MSIYVNENSDSIAHHLYDLNEQVTTVEIHGFDVNTLHETATIIQTLKYLTSEQPEADQKILQPQIDALEKKVSTLLGRVQIYPSLDPLPARHDAAFASTNQYDGKFEKINTNGDQRRSACTPTAAHAAAALLDSPDGLLTTMQLDQILEEGQKTMAQTMRTTPYATGDHLNFLDIQDRFPRLKSTTPPALRTEADIVEGEITKSIPPDTQRFYETLLTQFLEHARQSHQSDIAIVMTSGAESYAIHLHAASPVDCRIRFFDSHGYTDARFNNPEKRAYIIAFANIREAAEFLSRRRPHLDGEGVDWYNAANFYPLFRTAAARPRTPEPVIPPPIESPYLRQIEKLETLECAISLPEVDDRSMMIQMGLADIEDEDKALVDNGIYYQTWVVHKRLKIAGDGIQDYGRLSFTKSHSGDRAKYNCSEQHQREVIQRVYLKTALNGCSNAVMLGDTRTLTNLLGRIEQIHLTLIPFQEKPIDSLRRYGFLQEGARIEEIAIGSEEDRAQKLKDLERLNNKLFGDIGL